MILRDVGMELYNCPHSEKTEHSICKPHGFMFKVERHFRWNWKVLNPITELLNPMIEKLEYRKCCPCGYGTDLDGSNTSDG